MMPHKYHKGLFFRWLIPFLIISINAQSIEFDKPNILFCISDDQSWIHTSMEGEKAISTPAFDRIAHEGIYFRNAFCAAPSCSPSRGAIITGQEMWRLGEAAQLFSAVPLELEEMSFPLLLADNGYFIGFTQKGWSPNDFNVYGWAQYPLGKAFNMHKINPPANGMVKNDYAANFEEFLSNCPENKPFFFWFGSSEPHRVYEANSGFNNGIDPGKIKIPGFLPEASAVRYDIADYLLEIKWIDQHLEKMINILEEKKLLDNTIVIITSDNGMPFPGAKNNLYEYGIHIPLAIHWPDGIQSGGRVIDDLISLTDIAPTLLECAGVDVPDEMTGKSLLKIFRSSSSGCIDKSRKFVFSGKERHTVCRDGDLPYPQRSVRDHQFLFIRNIEPDRWPAGSPVNISAHGWIFGDIDMSPSMTYLIDNCDKTEVKGLFEFATAKRPYEELYDVIKDPFCLNNLILDPEFKKIKNRLSNVLDKYLIETQDPRAITGKSVWDNYPYYFQNPDGIVPYSKVKE